MRHVQGAEHQNRPSFPERPHLPARLCGQQDTHRHVTRTRPRGGHRRRQAGQTLGQRGLPAPAFVTFCPHPVVGKPPCPISSGTASPAGGCRQGGPTPSTGASHPTPHIAVEGGASQAWVPRAKLAQGAMGLPPDLKGLNGATQHHEKVPQGGLVGRK